MQVQPYFGGRFKFGEWLPLHVTLANAGPALRAEVRADTTEAGGQTTYSMPVELPTGARKRLTLYVQPPSFAQAVRVRLTDGARDLANQSVQLTVERNINYLVGVIAPRSEAFAALGGLTLNSAVDEQAAMLGGQQLARTITRIPMSLSDIPDRPEGLRLLDALILSGVDTSELTPDQKQALQAWVEQGGRLILGGGAGAARLLNGLPEALTEGWLPIDSPTEISLLDALGEFGEQAVRVPGPFTAAWPAAGRALIEQDDRVLLAERLQGKGHVNYAALDLSGSPFDAWAGAAAFWAKLLTPGSAYPINTPPDAAPRLLRANSLYYALQNLPVLELPSIDWLAGLLAVYIVLVGPVNYFILRKTRRLAWGWITILGLTLLFSAGTFAFGSSIRGGDVIINQISMLVFDARGIASPVQSYVGIFSPDRGAYTLNFPGRALVAPISAEGNPWGPWGPGGPLTAGQVELVQGESAQARNVQVSPAAMQGFQTESPMPENWRIESDLTLDGDQVRGTLINRTNEPIRDAAIVYGNRFARLGEVPPGQSQALDLTLQQTFGSPFPYFLFEEAFRNVGPTGPSRETQVRQQILESHYQSFGGPAQAPDRPTLIGWLRASPLEVQVDGVRWATQQTSLMIATLNIAYPPGPVRLPFGSVPVRLESVQGSGGLCGAYGEVYLDFNSSATLEFQLPPDLIELRVTRLAWRIATPGIGESTIELYDRDGEWVKQDAAEVGDPTRFVATSGAVRLRVSNTGNSSGCGRYELEIEGELQNE